MKKYSVILFLCFFSSSTLFAQQAFRGGSCDGDTTRQASPRANVSSKHMGGSSAKEVMEKIQDKRRAFFTEAMDLTPDEAEVFWPIYNQYAEKRNKLARAKRQILKKSAKQHTLSISEAEASSLLNELIELQEQENSLQKEYYKKFKAVLSAQKTLLLYKAEDEFTQNLLKHLRQHQHQHKSGK